MDVFLEGAIEKERTNESESGVSKATSRKQNLVNVVCRFDLI